MFPASFAPYIIKLIAPELTEKIANHVANHVAKAFKLPQLVNYMELPNDADQRLDRVEAQVKMLAEDQHPPAIDLDEWADVKDTIKKIKNKKAFKSLGK